MREEVSLGFINYMQIGEIRIGNLMGSFRTLPVKCAAVLSDLGSS